MISNSRWPNKITHDEYVILYEYCIVCYKIIMRLMILIKCVCIYELQSFSSHNIITYKIVIII